MTRRILFLTPHPIGESPSQRFRFEQYFDLLTRSGFTYEIQSFLSKKNARVMYLPGNTLRKMAALIAGLVGRFGLILKLKHFDFVFIHREASPIGPPLFEWIISRLFKKKVIYDFDDSIWLTDRPNESFFVRGLKWRSKVSSICRWSYRISCGNAHLCEFARRFNRSVTLNPTTVDTVDIHNPKKFSKLHGDRIVIGWTGSHSTLKYLEQLEDVLKSLESSHPAMTVSVIADKAPTIDLTRLEVRKWSVETEISDLARFDIGIMPLPDDDWSKGKCGFKALQYMAMEIPCVASPVGVNTMIITDGKNGFLAKDKAEWERVLTLLIKDGELRRRIGIEGRRTVEQLYSTASNSSVFLSLFEKS